MENEKNYMGFLFLTNMANFEAFCRTKKLISNLFFLKSVWVTLSLNISVCRARYWVSTGCQQPLFDFPSCFLLFCLRSSLILKMCITFLFQVKNYFIKFPEFPNWFSHCNTKSFYKCVWRGCYLYFLTCNSNIILWLKSFKCNCKFMV